MKSMLKIPFCLLVFLFMAGCEKDKKEYPQPDPPDYILAGQDTGQNVLFSDLIPNDTFYFKHPGSGWSRVIDLDQDGIPDFELGYGNSVSPGHTGIYSSIKVLGSGGIATDSSHNTWTLPFQAGDTIREGLFWYDSLSVLYSYFSSISSPPSSSGLWNGKADACIGLRLYKPDDTLYGWVSAGMPTSYTFIVRSWAVRK